jgi:hypothetical protein
MPEDAARCFGAAMTDPGTRNRHHPG